MPMREGRGGECLKYAWILVLLAAIMMFAAPVFACGPTSAGGC